jgi:hypothetical protein
MEIVQDDLNTLTEYWNIATRRLNGSVDDAFAECQNHAYEIGCKRATQDIIDLAKRYKKALDENDEKELKFLLTTLYKMADA